MSELPVLLIIPYDLLNMASGNPMVHDMEDGTSVLVRIPTPEELSAAGSRGSRATPSRRLTGAASTYPRSSSAYLQTITDLDAKAPPPYRLGREAALLYYGRNVPVSRAPLLSEGRSPHEDPNRA